jgi:hypothetical protein
MKRQPDEPKTPEGKFLTEARAAAIRTAVQHLRVIDRLKNGERNPRCSPRVDHGSPRPPGDFLFDMAKLHLESYTKMLGLTDRYADSFVDRVRHMARQQTAEPFAGRPLCILGPFREWGSDVFQVANNTRTPAVVCFKVSPARSEDGCNIYPLQHKIEPLWIAQASKEVGEMANSSTDGWRLDPYRKRKFSLRVKLDGGLRPKHRYFAEVDVIMRGRLVEQLPIEIEVQPRA